MNPTSKKALPCAVFGHNYEKVKTNPDQSLQLKCKHCHIVENTSAYGDFEEHQIPNTHIISTLRKLYHLHFKSAQHRYS